MLAIGFFIGFSDLEVRADTSIEVTVENETGLQDKYVDYILKLGLNNSDYKDLYYDTKKDLVKKSGGPIISLGETHYQVMKSITTYDINRPSQYFMPDALYSVAYDIKTLMQYNYYKNRGGYQRFFDSYNEDIKQSIVFCEAILEYTGEDKDSIANFTRAYEMYVLGYTETIDEALKANNIQDANDYVSRIFEMDNSLNQSTNIEDLKQVYEMPYLLGYSTKENLLEAAFSLVGKVRYTWAGGHAMTSYIKGINPVWIRWEQLYPKDSSQAGYGSCIKPSGSWCPIHGYNEDDRCINNDLVSDFASYLSLRAETLEDDTLLESKYSNMLSYIDPEDGTAHRLDGLDCSGYTSWIFNQIQNKYNIDSSAMYFTRQSGIESVEFGSDMLPGDIFAWTSHIVMIVGKVSDNSKVYLTVEQTPNVLKFGTVYYSGYKESDLAYGMQIAREANKLIGNTDEEPHSYCMNSVGHYSVELEEGQDASSLLGTITSIETTEKPIESGESEYTYDDTYESEEEPIQQETQTVRTANAQYREIGRFNEDFLDSDRVIPGIEKTLDELNALEVVKYLITKLPLQYVSGYYEYDGSLFDKNTVSINIGTTIVR